MKSKILKILDLGIEYSIYVFIFYIPISIALVSVFAYMAVVLFLLKQLLSPDFTGIIRNKIFFCLLLVFFICMAASLINSGPFFVKSLKALFWKWGRFVLILWMIVDTFKCAQPIVKAVSVFLFSLTIVGLSALSQKFFGVEFLRHRSLDGLVLTGPFLNQIDLASYLICLIPVVLSFSLWKWKWMSVKIGFCLITVMLMAVVFLTHCRGGWVGLTAGLIFVILCVNYHRLPKNIFWVMFWAGYMFIVPLTAVGLFFLKKDQQRIVLLQGACKMIKEHPFIGKGLGTFMDYSVQYTNNPWPCYAHNCFIQIWAESGIFSLLSFFLLNGYVFYKILRMILSRPASFNSFLLIGLGAGLLGFLTHSFFDTQLYSFQASFLFWVVLSLIVALTTGEELWKNQENTVMKSI